MISSDLFILASGLFQFKGSLILAALERFFCPRISGIKRISWLCFVESNPCNPRNLRMILFAALEGFLSADLWD